MGKPGFWNVDDEKAHLTRELKATISWPAESKDGKIKSIYQQLKNNSAVNAERVRGILHCINKSHYQVLQVSTYQAIVVVTSFRNCNILKYMHSDVLSLMMRFLYFRQNYIVTRDLWMIRSTISWQYIEYLSQTALNLH